MKTVIFGGTFDPPHMGHLRLMEKVISAVEPDRFVIVPAYVPPQKSESEVTDSGDRFEMCRRLALYSPVAEVSDFEIAGGGKSYTVFTAEHFRDMYHGDTLYLALGSDAFARFPQWYRAERITELAELICVCRSEAERELCERTAEEIKRIGGRCTLISSEPFECSSSDIKDRIARGLPVGGLLPPAVADYIEKRGLYRDR